MKQRSLTPTGLRLILSLLLFFVAISGSFIFSYTDINLREYAKDISHTVVDASASQNNLQTLQVVEKELAAKKDVVDRASSIVAESKSYQYQNQIITDLNDYASKSGIAITNIDFSAAGKSGVAGMAATGQPATPTAPTINGVKSTSVSITLKNPVVYENMLRFIKSIEKNLTKMQISKISLSKDAASGKVTSEALTVEVYIR